MQSTLNLGTGFNLQSIAASNEARHLENLNPPQKEAVQHKDGPILVLAGAGTGKTRILTRRIANLIVAHKVRPSSILAVTFTNKAAGEMRERLKLLIGNISQSLWVSTFHSMGLRMLRRHAPSLGFKNDFTVYDSGDSKDLLKRILKDQGIDDKKYPVSSFSGYIERQKNIPVFPEEVPAASKNSNDAQKKQVYELYQRALRSANAMDFGDLLSFTYQLLQNHPSLLHQYQDQLNYLLVDEFQDTNDVQYKIIKLLAGPKKNLLVVGDDDQSIYAFRGATIQNIQDFEKDFPGAQVVKLEQNYRSTANVLDGAHSVIIKNKGRKDKKVWTAEGSGEPVHLFAGIDETEEAMYIAREIKKRIAGGLNYEDIACFYRTNAQSRAMEEAFLSHRIPYRIFGGLKFYDRKEIKDIIAYLRLVANQNDNQAFLRVINTPTRGIGAQTVVQIAAAAKDEGVSFYEAARMIGSRNKSVGQFVTLIDGFIRGYQDKKLFELLKEITEKTKYIAGLKAMKDDPQAESRLENIQELLGLSITLEVPEDGDPLQHFLDRVALTAGDDTPLADNSKPGEPKKTPNDTVSLMTLHLAKGLEYEVVFFTGFEEGLVPHHRTIYAPDEVDEERRLCYVGMTRAKQILYITRAKKRGMFSAGGDTTSSRFREASRFAFDIPKGVMDDPLSSFFTSLEFDTYSETSTVYEEDTSVNRRGTSKKPSQTTSASKNRGGYAPKALKSADEMFAEAQSSVNHLRPVADEDLAIGLRIVHPSFGQGVIEAIDGDPETTKNLKVMILFDGFPDTKKLIFKFAGLRHSG